MWYALDVVNVKLSNDLFISIWDFIFKFKKIHMSKTTSFTFSKNSNKRFFFFNCQRQHHSLFQRIQIKGSSFSIVKDNIIHFFKKIKPNLLLLAYDKMSTLSFSKNSNLIFYFLHMTKWAHFTFQIFQTKSSTFCISLKKHQSLLKIFK